MIDNAELKQERNKMAKIKVIINIPDNDCRNCPYFSHTSKEVSYHQDVDYYRCTLFGNVDLKGSFQNGFKRCVACQSCEVNE